MLVFELCVGIYFPAFGTLKSMLVPENVRSSVYNWFRVPLNAIVLGILLIKMSTKTVFMWCSIFLATASLIQVKLANMDLTQKEDEDEVPLVQTA